VVLSTDGVQRLAVGLRAGALPAVTLLEFNSMHVRDAGASALAAALGRGALPRLQRLWLTTTPPSSTRGWWPWRRPCGGGPRWRLSHIGLAVNPFSDEGLAALVAPPPPPRLLHPLTPPFTALL